ncbi:MAG: hypothetical protein ACREBD_21315 [Blastocatellia bacterium]
MLQEKIYSFFLKDLAEAAAGKHPFRPGYCLSPTDQLHLHRPVSNHNPRQRGSGSLALLGKILTRFLLLPIYPFTVTKEAIS